ncbi:hypothetical protein ACHAXR_012235 [Thalassiosira sp. AJA248-18]
MTMVALHCIGGNAEEVIGFERKYISERKDAFPSCHQTAHQECFIDRRTFVKHLGSKEDVFNFREFFRTKISIDGISTVLQDFLSQMEPWLHDGQWHPLLRLAFVDASGHPDERLFADGLAYLATKCVKGKTGSLEHFAKCFPGSPAAPLPVASAMWKVGDPTAIWANLPHKGAVEAWLTAQFEGEQQQPDHPHDDVQSVMSAQLLCTLPEVTSWALGGVNGRVPSAFLAGPILQRLLVEMARLAMRLFLTIPRGSTLHGFTVAQGVASLLESGIVAPEQQARIASRFWVWLTSLYIAKGTPVLVSLTSEGLKAMASMEWHLDLLPRARAMIGHAHIIKLAYSSFWFWSQMDQDPLMKFAVLRCLEASHPWRVDQPFQCEHYLQATVSSEAFRANSRARAKVHVQKLLAKSGSWDLAWEQSTTPWELGSANKVLVDCLDQVPAHARCLVPGCGSGHDLLALANGQRSVHGLEISKAAGDIARQTVSTGLPGIQVVVADFFTFHGAYDFIFDHTFFCALPPCRREHWATKMAELLQPGGVLLAVIWPLGPSTEVGPAGPPFKSSVANYHRLLKSKGLALTDINTLSFEDNLGKRTVAVTWWQRSQQNSQDLIEIAQILDHWFQGEDGSHNPYHYRAGTSLTQVQFWMMAADNKHDALIKSKFEALYESIQVDQAKFDRWKSTSRGCVALVLLLDQFTRHMFRGTSRMFESDELAMEVASHALQNYLPRLRASPNLPKVDGAQAPFDWPLSWCQVWFLTLSWSHSEHISDHDVGIAHIETAITSMPQMSTNDANRSHFEKVLLMAQNHKSIIAKYGRYPHRNAVLHRKPTELEAREWNAQHAFERSVAKAPSEPLQRSHLVPMLKLYLARYSANCLGPWLTLQWLQKHHGVKFEVVDVDILNAEQMTPEYRALNPNHTVPLLLDLSHEPGTEPLVVFESHSIMRYLARRFDKALNPPSELASLGPSICWALEFRLGRLYPVLEKVTYPAMGFSQDFESVNEWKFCLSAALCDFASAFLQDSKGLIGGSRIPTIADFAIAPCLQLLKVTNIKPPQTVVAYLERFMMACPDALVVFQGDGQFGILDYIKCRKEGGYIKVEKIRKYLSPRPAFLPPSDQTLLLSSSEFCVESLPVRILMAALGAKGLASSTRMEFQGPCIDPFSSDLPLFCLEQGAVAGGCNAILRYLCDMYELQEMYPTDLQRRADVDTVLDFCCTVLRRFLREAMFPVFGLGGDAEKASQAQCRLPGAVQVVESYLSKSQSAFLCSTPAPSIADVAVVPCLLFYNRLGMKLPPTLDEYLGQCYGHWQVAEELPQQVMSLKPALSTSPPADILASGRATDVDFFRAGANQALHHLGSVADPITTIIHAPLKQLPPSHRQWDDLAADLPELVRNLRVRRQMDRLPILDASTKALPDKFLSRASSLLAIFAHSYWYNEFNNEPEALPLGIWLPWKQVTKRLNRPVPVMTYEDLYTYNWQGDPRQVTTSRLATPNTGSVAEQRFYLGTVAMSFAGAPVVELASRAARQCQADDIVGLMLTLQQIRGCVKELDRSFRFLSLKRGNPGFVDPVVWTMTVATFAMSFVNKLETGLPNAIAPSGNSLPILHVLDAIFGRDVYKSHLADMTKSMLGPEVMAPQHRELIALLRKLRLRDQVKATRSPEVITTWNAIIKSFIDESGWLGTHRRKVYGFILVAAIVGRPHTLLNIKLNVQGFQKDAEGVNSLLLQEVDARQGLLVAEKDEFSVRPTTATGLATKADSIDDAQAKMPEVDLGSLCLHNHKDDLWVAISGKVFDLTAFAQKHKGGEHILRYFAGLDATGAFMTVHSYMPLPMKMCVGVFVEHPLLGEQEPLARLLTSCTLFLNSAGLEYSSILQHRCVCDEYDEHGKQTMLWSPYNLMLLLRMYHKLLEQMLPCIIQEMTIFLRPSQIQQIAGHSCLSAFKRISQVPESLRASTAAHMAFVSEIVNTVHFKIESSIKEVRALGISWLRDGVPVTEEDVVEPFRKCFEAVSELVGVFDGVIQSRL